jgi:glucuronoarabinoxylan endo-1,4-beta-xylanase
MPILLGASCVVAQSTNGTATLSLLQIERQTTVTDTSLNVSPNPASGTVGGDAIIFTAVGNNNGTPYAITVSSSNLSVAKASGANVSCVAAGGPVTITAANGSLMGTAQLTCVAPSGNAASVSWGITYQTIDGFGVGDLQHQNQIGQAVSVAPFLFGTTAGSIGLSLLRVEVPDNSAKGPGVGDCSSVSASCAGPGYVADLKAALAQSPQVRVWASPLSPPASMKTNGSVICMQGAGKGALSPSSYPDFARWLANYINSWSSLYGINIYAMSLQNEPDICEAYDSAVYTAEQLDSFIKNNLAPTFLTNGFSTLIMMPESSNYAGLVPLADTCMADPACYPHVGIIAWHDYDATFRYPTNSTPSPYASKVAKYWMSEVSSQSGLWDPHMDEGLVWAALIDGRMAVDNANAWLQWTIYSVSSDDNLGLIRRDTGKIAKRAYVIGNYSLFVRPGWVRIAATHVPQKGITVSAYKDPSGSKNFAIVVTNYNRKTTDQTINFSDFTASTATPWITSEHFNLIQKSNVTAGGGFTYALPGRSVVTFVGTAN